MQHAPHIYTHPLRFLTLSLPAGKATPIFTFKDGRCEVMLTLDLKEGTLRFTHQGKSIGTIASIKGPVHAAVTVTSSKQTVGGQIRAGGPQGEMALVTQLP